MIKTLKDKDEFVKDKAIVALGKIRDTRAIKPLTLMLESRHLYLRKEAVSALAKIGKPSKKALYKALTNKDEEVRNEAAVALGNLGDTRAIKQLTLMLEFKYSYMRKRAVSALVNIGKPAAKELHKTLKDEDEEISKIAYDALIKMGEINENDQKIKKEENIPDSNGHFRTPIKIEIPDIRY